MATSSRTGTTASLVIGVLTLAAIAVSNVPSPAASAGRQRATTGVYSQSAPGTYVLGAANLDDTDPFGDSSIEATLPYDAGGVGILGYANPAKSYGVYGVTFGTNGIGVYGAGDGPTPAPGNTPDATQRSTGVVGNSASGDGVYGSTQFPNGSDTSLGGNPVAGVFGADVTTNGNENNGVAGTTLDGGYGVAGLSSDANYGGGNIAALGGVLGTATAGDGVDGVAGSGSGVAGTSRTGAGVIGSSEATEQVTKNSYGGVFEGAYVSLLGQTTTPNGSTSYPLVLRNAGGNDVFSVDNAGDFTYSGTIETETRTASGAVATMYAAKTGTPTLEDVGTASIANGVGRVAIDPVLVAQMDRSTPYRVFLTPDGDTRGLYVARKSPQGFVVREARGGHGTLTFDYRIVAYVDGQSTRRMALHVPTGPSSSTRSAAGESDAATRAKRRAFERTLKAGVLRRGEAFYVPQANEHVEHRSLPAEPTAKRYVSATIKSL